MMQNTVQQNAQYTFKYNASIGRHGWLRLTPAYSVRLVEEILDDQSQPPRCVLEPFSGTGTTELVCGNRGIHSYAFEINPFLVWLAKVKTASYTDLEVAAVKTIAKEIVYTLDRVIPAPLPPIFHIHRWWGDEQLLFLAKLKNAVVAVDNPAEKNLLKIAFCRMVIQLSNASFNHVSTSFGDTTDVFFDAACAKSAFLDACDMLADSARIQPLSEPVILHHDARTLPPELSGSYDMVITSPPYPNRVSYIRELRPYMYWLDYLSTSEQAGEMDWNTIGGTWGLATSKLANWKPTDCPLPFYLYDVIGRIAQADNKSAPLMAKYVHKYFEDIAVHLNAVYDGLSTGGQVYYIVGNSSFYGITVPSEKLYGDIMAGIGFNRVKHRIVRKRNCNKCLYEFVITGTK